MDAGSLVPAPHVAGPLRLLPFRAIRLAPNRVGTPFSAGTFTRSYDEVRERMRRWQRRGHLVQDETPSVYVHEYTADGITVRGIVGALDLSHRATTHEHAAVHPHEGVHAGQVEELAHRMARIETQPAPILLVHQGPAEVRALLDRIQRDEPAQEFSDRAGQHHRVWVVQDPADLAALDESLAGSTAVIADGHHRYAAYLRAEAELATPAAGAGLAMLVDQDDTPLFLGAVHRALAGTDLAAVRVAADALGAAWTPAPRDAAVAALGPHTIVATDGAAWATLAVDPTSGRPAVEWLHAELVPLIAPPPTVTYHHSADSALAAVDPSARTVVLLLPAPDFSDVLAASAAGRLLPEKATSFQPKPHVGVFIRSLRDG